MKIKASHWWFGLFCCLTTAASGQYQLHIEAPDTAWKGNAKHTLADSALAVGILGEISETLFREGLLAHQWVVTSRDSQSRHLKLMPGPRFRWARLDATLIPPEWVTWQPVRALGKPLSIRRITLYREQILRQAEQHGFPFARVWFDSIYWRPNVVARLRCETGPLIRFDTLIIHGDSGVSPRFIGSYLGIRKGAIYDERLVRQMDARLRALPFVRPVRNSLVSFSHSEARIDVYLERQPASKFNFLIGVQPGNGTGQKLRLTGEADLELQGALGAGEEFRLQWRGLRQASPELRIHGAVPYALGSPLGPDGGLELYKRDSTWIDVSGELGLRYFIIGSDYLRLLGKWSSSSALVIDTSAIKKSGHLPAVLDNRERSVGLSVHLDRTNSRLAPSRGFTLDATLFLGQRRIRPNPTILALSDSVLDFQALYDSLDLSSPSWEGALRWDGFVSITSLVVLRIGFQGWWVHRKDILQNELVRLGGASTIRGFNEESIDAARAGILKIEPRLQLGGGSYLFAFLDVAYVENPIAALIARPFGFGSGLAFRTKSGVLALSYALGRLNDANPIQFRNAKVHIGYFSSF